MTNTIEGAYESIGALMEDIRSKRTKIREIEREIAQLKNIACIYMDGADLGTLPSPARGKNDTFKIDDIDFKNG